MVKPKERIAPSGPTQIRPERDSAGAWLRPTEHMFLSKCPFNVFALKTLLEFRGAVAEKFQKGNTNRLRFVVEPSRLYQSRQFLGDLVGQINIYRFHSNSILGDKTVCTHALRVSPGAVRVKPPQASWQAAPIRWKCWATSRTPQGKAEPFRKSGGGTAGRRRR